jgi:hypothetical protein
MVAILLLVLFDAGFVDSEVVDTDGVAVDIDLVVVVDDNIDLVVVAVDTDVVVVDVIVADMTAVVYNMKDKHAVVDVVAVVVVVVVVVVVDIDLNKRTAVEVGLVLSVYVDNADSEVQEFADDSIDRNNKLVIL